MSQLSAHQGVVAQRVLGKGLMVEEIAPGSGLGFDLVFATGPDGDGFQMQTGVENLGQDLKVALVTCLGSDIFNTTFGFDGIRVFTQPFTKNITKQLIELAIVKTLTADARVKRVLSVSLEPTSPEERRWTVEVEAQTVLGDVLRLVLGEVDPAG